MNERGTPAASSPDARKRMRSTRQRDTKPEIAIRSRLHRMGLRFRVDLAPLKGVRRRADIIFTRVRVAVFVDGCFWHCCPEHGTWPKSNAEWWRQKLLGNQQRDRDTDRRLRDAGWTVIRVWEHEEPEVAAERIFNVIADSR